MHHHPHRRAASEALASYAAAREPTAQLTRALLDAIAAMLAADHETSVTFAMHGISITRGPVPSGTTKLS
jgi:hypothetical protein